MLIAGLVVTTVSVAWVTFLLAVPWFMAAIGGIPFAAPMPAAFLIVDEIIVGSAAILAALWIAALRTVQWGSRWERPPQYPWR